MLLFHTEIIDSIDLLAVVVLDIGNRALQHLRTPTKASRWEKLPGGQKQPNPVEARLKRAQIIRIVLWGI